MSFDHINRDLLFLKLRAAGIDDKMYFSIKSLYIKTKACVKVKVFTEWFNTSCGVRQGDTLSLYSIFINDLILSVNGLKLGRHTNEIMISTGILLVLCSYG